MFGISRVSAMKVAGMLGSLIFGGMTIANGDLNTGLGIIAAAFSSAGLAK